MSGEFDGRVGVSGSYGAAIRYADEEWLIANGSMQRNGTALTGTFIQRVNDTLFSGTLDLSEAP